MSTEPQPERHILTVGELRREMNGLADECTVEVAVGGAGYGDGITAESDNDGEVGWLSIFVQPPTFAPASPEAKPAPPDAETMRWYDKFVAETRYSNALAKLLRENGIEPPLHPGGPA